MAFERRFSRYAAALLLLAVTVPSFPAEVRAAPTAADKETARSLMSDGDRKFAAKDFAGALAAYKAAHAIMNVPTTGIEVAKAQEALGQLVEARDTLLGILRETPSGSEPAAFKKARADAEERAASLASRVPSIRIVVSGPDPSAPRTVRLDGEELPAEAVSLPRKVDPGAHHIEVSAPGFNDAAFILTVAEGQNVEHGVALEPLPSSGAPPTARPAAPPVVEPPPAVTTSSRTSPWVYVGFGVGAAGILAGSITGAMSLSKTNTLKDQCPNNLCPSRLAGDRDTAGTLATVADVSFAVGIIGVGVGVLALLSPKSSEQAPSATAVRPWVSLGSVGVSGGFE